MRFSKFFIDRPIFASVLSILIVLSGGVAVWTLPLAQYPEITPPTVEVSAYYPGANSRVVADTVAAPIEERVNGVENMLYMSSQCTNDGTYTLTITFRIGINLNMAQVLVQNRVALAEPVLPDLVKRRGVTVKKKSSSILMIVNLFSPDNSRDNLYLSNYATIQLRDELARLEGVGDITYLGQRDYSMRVWLDPEKMSFRNLTASDVTRAIEQQNVQVAAGQIGQPPVPRGQVFQYTMSTLGRLVDASQFQEMILKNDAQGRIVRLQDVARIELGAQGYDQACTLDGRPSVALSIYQRPGTNSLETARLVRGKMEELKTRFGEGLDYAIVYDTTPFITESVREVRKTMRDAVILVAVVVLLFLQNWRSAVIPLVAVPVAIVGTFAVMAALGYSLNNLMLLGLVLAIGIVVDDAIVVVEAVEHHIERGLTPRAATIQAMEEVSRPVVAIGLVLTAVFVPCAFITGIVGQFFRQFALTIATSTLISAFNSLTLSPALAAILLRPRSRGRSAEALPPLLYVVLGAWGGWAWFLPWVVDRLKVSGPGWWVLALAIVGGGALLGWALSGPLNRFLSWFFALFNAWFEWSTRFYTRLVGGLLRVSVLVLLLYGGLLGLTYWGFMNTPTGFIPSQDKGYLLVNVQLPDSTSVEQTQNVMARIEAIARRDPKNPNSKREGVSHTVALAGQSILLNANAPNFGAMYVMLDDFHHRTRPALSADAIAARLQDEFQNGVPDGLINVFGAPPVEGLGTASGFRIVIEDRGDLGLENLQSVTEKAIADGGGTAELNGLFTSIRANTPRLYLDIDRPKLNTMGVSMNEVFNTLQVYLGSLYVNDFNRFGRTWQVNVQGDANFRRKIEDLKLLKVRSGPGGMVPLGSLIGVRDMTGPVMISRYNMYPAATINGVPGPGVSSGQAIDRMERVVSRDLPHEMRFEWTELALLQLETGVTAMLVFVLAVVLVFLVLAAQYESWSLPLAVILVVPMCLLCSIAGVAYARMDINIFTQVGFIVLVGLACKNAILIVEFAKSRRESGVSGYEATLEACALRLRPIMMTSLAFVLGVVPLVVSEGAGAEMRRTLGTAVFSGMLGVTLFGIFLTPVFYFVIQWLHDRWGRSGVTVTGTDTANDATDGGWGRHDHLAVGEEAADSELEHDGSSTHGSGTQSIRS
ncbi:MAG: multidrug efflux RND transporter permease subunit [Isosphaeraceae bacterium]